MPRSNARSNRRPPVPRGPSRLRLRGRGDYTTEILEEPNYARRLEKKIDHLERSLVLKTPSASKGAGLAGRALGSLVGQGDLGAMAGEGLAKLFGFGDYRVAVKGNSLMAGLAESTVPKFSGDGKRGVRLTEREFLGNIVAGTVTSGSSAFSSQSFSIVPTDVNTFPWLSRIAKLFDQWEPHGIVFEFQTTSSTFNGTSQALGAVIMATDYDASDPPFTSKQVMENSDYACSAVPSSNLVHGIECDPKERPLDVMYTQARPGLANFSTLGNFQIATQGCSVSGVTLGELWISYDITFYKKVLSDLSAGAPGLATIGLQAVGDPLLPTTIEYQSQLTLSPVVGTGTDILFPPSQGSGRYCGCFYTSKYTASSTYIPTGTNCTVSTYSATPTGAGSGYMVNFRVTITASNAKIRFGLQATADATNSFSMIATPDTFVPA